MWSPSSTPSPVRSRPNRPPAILAALVAAGLLVPGPGAAQVVVFDPRNHLENALQAARQLESLANEARSLAASPYSHLTQSSRSLRDMAELADKVEGLASAAGEVERQFETLYAADPMGAGRRDLLAQGEARAATTLRTAEDVARTAAALERLGQGRDERLVGALSAGEAAVGQTAAIQSSNQILAVLAEELASMRVASLAQARLAAEQAARRSADGAAGDAARRARWSAAPTTPQAPAFDPLSRARE